MKMLEALFHVILIDKSDTVLKTTKYTNMHSKIEKISLSINGAELKNAFHLEVQDR